MPDDAIERRIAEVLTRDRSNGLCPLDGPCASCDCFDPLHEYDRANAKAVMAEVVAPELGRLRNRITVLEANGSELLAERDTLRAAIETLSARHRPTIAKNLIRCDRHVNMRRVSWEELRDCSDCRDEPITVCSNLTCCEYPCDDRRAIDDALDAPESNADAPSPVTAATEAHGETTEAQEGGEPLIDPDCRDGKHGSCFGGPCECDCHGESP